MIWKLNLKQNRNGNNSIELLKLKLTNNLEENQLKNIKLICGMPVLAKK